MQEDDAGVARAREGAQAGQTAAPVPGGHPEGRRGPLPGMKCSIQSKMLSVLEVLEFHFLEDLN